MSQYCLLGTKAEQGLTVWKFHDFFITQILREINFGDSRSAKSAILTHSEALNFDFNEISHFLKAEISKLKYNLESLKWQKRAFLELLHRFSKIDLT